MTTRESAATVATWTTGFSNFFILFSSECTPDVRASFCSRCIRCILRRIREGLLRLTSRCVPRLCKLSLFLSRHTQQRSAARRCRRSEPGGTNIYSCAEATQTFVFTKYQRRRSTSRVRSIPCVSIIDRKPRLLKFEGMLLASPWLRSAPTAPRQGRQVLMLLQPRLLPPCAEGPQR